MSCTHGFLDHSAHRPLPSRAVIHSSTVPHLLLHFTVQWAMNNHLPIRLVFGSTFLIIRKHIILMVVLSILCYLSGVKTESLLRDIVPINIQHFQPLIVTVLTYLIFTISITKLTIETYKNRIHPTEKSNLIERMKYQSKLLLPTNAMEIARILGLVMFNFVFAFVLSTIFFIVFFIVLLVVLVTAQYPSDLWLGILRELTPVIFVILVVLLGILSIRWSLAIPYVVVESSTVRGALEKSWRATASHWKTLAMIGFLTLLIALVLGGLFDLLVGLAVAIGSEAPSETIYRTTFVMGGGLGATVIATCYYFGTTPSEGDGS